MKSLQNFLFLVLYVCFFIGCSEETKKEVKEAAEAVTAESKEQLSEMTDNAKDQVSETVEVLFSAVTVISSIPPRSLSSSEDKVKGRIEIDIEINEKIILFMASSPNLCAFSDAIKSF